MTDGYEIRSIAELELPSLPQFPRTALIRRHFGIESFGVNAYTAKEAGEAVIGEHDESSGTDPGNHQELYVVLSGSATFTVDGETVDGPAVTLVFVRDPATKRQAIADEEGTTIIVVGAKEGEAFTMSTWERSAPAFAYFATQEYDKAVELLSKAAEQYPDDPTVLYNLACGESLSGRRSEAIEHLRRAVAQGERFRDLAKTDTDLDPIRDEPEFQEIFAS